MGIQQALALCGALTTVPFPICEDNNVAPLSQGR